MNGRAARIAQLEQASEGLASLTSERDQLQTELQRQVEATAELRSRLEAVQAQVKARADADAELAQLAAVAKEAIGQLSDRLKGG